MRRQNLRRQYLNCLYNDMEFITSNIRKSHFYIHHGVLKGRTQSKRELAELREEAAMVLLHENYKPWEIKL